MNHRLQIALHRVQLWDLDWCIRLNRYSTRRFILQPFKLISRLGDGWAWYALLAGILVWSGWVVLPYLIQTLLTSAVGLGLYKLLKHKTVRPRPYQVLQAVRLGERPLDHFSFPSGHTLHAVLFTMMLGALQPVLLYLMVPFMLLVALSRVILGLHYPTDVMAGAALGAGLAQLSMNIW
ncbi:MAG: phosphatase PAP2 family protein [Pseudomonadota bacterium]|nr:phosphatase PAP2 family protein [Pseudomonadota bacterium]